jgi:hypothetical protein
MLHEFLQMAQHNSGRSPVLLRCDSRRREGQCLQEPGICSYFPFLFRSLPFFTPSFLFCPGTGNEEGREQWVGHKDVGCARATASLEPRDVGGQAVGPSQT